MAKHHVGHLRKYNPFIEFKTDINRTLDRHIQINNTIMMAGFGALGGGMVMLYQKTEIDKKELNQKIDTIDNKLTEVLVFIATLKKWS